MTTIVSSIVVIGILFFVATKMSGLGKGNSTEDFMTTFSQKENAVLVDVRTLGEYAEGHIEGAQNVDFYDPAFIEKMKALGIDKEFFIYCRSGNRSGQAVATLRTAGFTVEDLPGGIMSHPELLK